MGIIYCFTNKINGKKYIGQTINPKQRYNNHMCDIYKQNRAGYNSPLARAMRKYGKENFSYEVLAKDINDIDILNILEKEYIEKYKSLTTQHGYNILEGGLNASKPKSLESRKKMSQKKGSLSEDEVIQLRIAYKNHESPSKIYNEQYKDKMHYNSFLNIWSGKRYAHILPDYIDNGRMTKISLEQAEEIRKRYKEEKTSYKKLAKDYNVDPSTIGSIVKGKTHKVDHNL